MALTPAAAMVRAGSGFAGAGGGHQVEKIDAFFLQFPAKRVRLGVVAGENTLLDLNYTDRIHCLHGAPFWSYQDISCKYSVRQRKIYVNFISIFLLFIPEFSLVFGENIR